ncbi:hypothetical protein I6N96_07270 [Enterococcus sp. BWM-S5]|uniref:DUF6892 domain-containing protein n=1 Tax=Enterococcus larvae TaxID=2794352 RepID=A0ABS4CHI0_9ENTE|nr:hypothetical protein [Enterococcus larvae]MBP1046079.1 hypothetical protein [Enterococcus larvae]
MFADLNFKLIVIDALLEKDPEFLPKLNGLKSTFVDSYEWYSETNPKPIPEILEFLENVILLKNDLDKVEELIFDGGSDIYSFLIPDWDGEDGIFDIASIQGFEQLRNLKRVHHISLCPQQILQPMVKVGIEIC